MCLVRRCEALQPTSTKLNKFLQIIIMFFLGRLMWGIGVTRRSLRGFRLGCRRIRYRIRIHSIFSFAEMSTLESKFRIGSKVASALAVDSHSSLCLHGHPKRNTLSTLESKFRILSQLFMSKETRQISRELNIFIHHCWQKTKKQINRRIKRINK